MEKHIDTVQSTMAQLKQAMSRKKKIVFLCVYHCAERSGADRATVLRHNQWCDATKKKPGENVDHKAD